MSTAFEAPPVSATPEPAAAPAAGAPGFRRIVGELASFTVVGTIGTALTFIGANLARTWFNGSPLTTVVIPMMISTSVSYFLNRQWTFRRLSGTALHREATLFFAFNAVGVVIQLLCMGVRSYSLHLNGTFSYNTALIVGTVLGTAFRYWSYKRWVFLPAEAS